MPDVPHGVAGDAGQPVRDRDAGEFMTSARCPSCQCLRWPSQIVGGKLAFLRLLFSLTVLLSPHVYGQERFEFKGVPLGASEKEFSEKLPLFRCSAPKSSSVAADTTCILFDSVSTACAGRMDGSNCAQELLSARTYGGVAANSIIAYFYEDQLGSMVIYLPSNQFERVASALREAVGPPQSEQQEEVKNRGGASFLNETLIWRRGDSAIRAEKHGGGVPESSIWIFLGSYMSEFAKRQRQTRPR